MSAKPTLATPRFRRRSSPVQGPDRRSGTLFQTDGAGIAGITLQDTETVALAAIRAGYRVADAQIERLQQLGKRVQSAGERLAGDEPQRQTIDHTEALVNKGILAALAWVEGLAAEPGSPLHRFVVAQYRLLGGLLGIEGAAPTSPSPPPVPLSKGAGPTAPGAGRPGPRVEIVHKGEARRRVVLRGIELSGQALKSEEPQGILFFHAQDLDADPIDATLIGLRVQIEVRRSSPAGRWSAALCDAEGCQYGWIEIEI